jgi:hypothetical protein
MKNLKTIKMKNLNFAWVIVVMLSDCILLVLVSNELFKMVWWLWIIVFIINAIAFFLVSFMIQMIKEAEAYFEKQDY